MSQRRSNSTHSISVAGYDSNVKNTATPERGHQKSGGRGSTENTTPDTPPPDAVTLYTIIMGGLSLATALAWRSVFTVAVMRESGLGELFLVAALLTVFMLVLATAHSINWVSDKQWAESCGCVSAKVRAVLGILVLVGVVAALILGLMCITDTPLDNSNQLKRHIDGDFGTPTTVNHGISYPLQRDECVCRWENTHSTQTPPGGV
jgi:hypothetical protein